MVQLVCLDIVNAAIKDQALDQDSLQHVRNTLFERTRASFQSSSGIPDSPAIQGKLTQIFTYLFLFLYPTTWSSFFTDFRAIAGDSSTIGISNAPATVFYLRLLSSIHDEIGDVLTPRSAAEQKLHNALKDMIRDRDAAAITNAWQGILSRWAQVNPAIVELCLGNVSRYVSWTDIALIVNPDMIRFLWDLATQTSDAHAAIRTAAIECFSEIISKKMQASDKIELMRFIDAPALLTRLSALDGLALHRNTSKYDNDLAETVAKLTNIVIFDIVKILDANGIQTEVVLQSNNLLQSSIPHLIRYLSDEYDEVTSIVIPSLTDLLTFFRKQAKAAGGLAPQYNPLLQSLLDTIILKMRYDETAEWGDDDGDREDADFQGLRKRLHVVQNIIATIDDTMYMETLSKIVTTTFTALDQQGARATSWQALDLALFEMYLFGELTIKNAGLYAKSAPKNVASQYLIEMMTRLLESDIGSFPHPAIQLQYMEICVRYCSYFDNHVQSIPRALQNFVRYVQTDHVKVKARSWYLFYKFIRPLRLFLGDVAQDVIRAIANVMVIKVELPAATASDDSDAGDEPSDGGFTSQLYLFEAVGCMCTISSIPVESQVYYIRAVLEPLIRTIKDGTAAAHQGDERALLLLHHTIMAIGTFAEGIVDRMPSSSQPHKPLPPSVAAEFVPCSTGILSTLETLKRSSQIRTAARHALTRLVGVLGTHIVQELPRWLEGLLSQTSTLDELSSFLRLLDQVMYGFKSEVSGILDQLLGPLLQRVFAGLAEPVTGTDDAHALAELKSQYLNFILIIFAQDLGAVIISATNQATFEPMLSSIEHFCRDANDYATAKLAYSVLTRMTTVWGGPDLPLTSPDGTNGSQLSPSPSMPGFDTFIMQRFSPLAWALIREPTFKSKDAQARLALGEAASLQWTILRKCGHAYENHLRSKELVEVGFSADMINVYLLKLRTLDVREFKKSFVAFVDDARGGR